MITAMERPTIRQGSRRIGYTPKEVAEMTGLHIGTVRRQIANGDLKAFRIGGKWLIPVGVIERRIAGLPD